MKHVNNNRSQRWALRSLIVGFLFAMLAGCGSGSSSSTDTESNTDNLTQGTCAAPTPGQSGYSLVFKGCKGAEVVYYDKTECVRDNATGLIWQGQTTSGLRSNGFYPTNFDDASLFQVNSVTRPTEAQLSAANNSLGFRNQVNAANLCGSSGWRVPSVEEMQTLLKFGNSPAVDAAWFPNMTANAVYWTSTPAPAAPDAACVVNFNTGAVTAMVRSSFGPLAASIRLVR